MSFAASSPENASIRLSGRRLSATGLPKRPRRPCQNGLAVKVSRHQRRQRSSVLRDTGRLSHLWIASSRRGVAPCRRAETSTTTGAANQRRPKNRTLGGVVRRRHPSVPQQKLKRFAKTSGSPGGAPRRARGKFALCKRPAAVGAHGLAGLLGQVLVDLEKQGVKRHLPDESVHHGRVLWSCG